MCVFVGLLISLLLLVVVFVFVFLFFRGECEPGEIASGFTANREGRLRERFCTSCVLSIYVAG